MSKDNRKFEVVFSGIVGANGELYQQGEILTAEQVGEVELHLSRQAVKVVGTFLSKNEDKKPEEKKEAK